MPPDSSSPRRTAQPRSRWNLLLLAPLLVLITPLYNSDKPRVLGFPLFYWLQFVYIPLSVACVAIVYLKTRERR